MPSCFTDWRARYMARGNVADQGRLGFLYLVELPANRIKIGFAEDVERRLEDSKVYTWVPDIQVFGRWKIRSNWEPHIRQFATDNIDDLDVIQGPGGSRSEVFEFVDADAKAAGLGTLCTRITAWIALYTGVYPLEEPSIESDEETRT